LYVWFEVMLMASFVLVVLGGERGQLEGAVKYVTLNLIASIFFLTAVGLLYGSVGTVNLAHLARLIPATERAAIPAAEMLLLIAFGIKAAVFPLFFWLPASYHTPPAAVSALFAGLLTKVGVYAIIRVFTLVFSLEGTATRDLLLGVAGLTMLSGVLGAIAQNEFRRILSFHIVSQIGYMILGLAILTPLALAATVYFIVHNIFAKSNLFLVSGIAYRLRGTYELKTLGGLYAIHPWLALCFFTSAMALAGMPPLSGFWGKFTLVWASLEASRYVLAALALVVGVLTLYSMTKIWNEAFWTPAEDEDAPPPASNDMNGNLLQRVALFAPVFVLAAAVVVMGLAVDPLFRLADEAAGQLLDSSHYIEAVLGRE
jgi:multicomponent Na+:H+ antiporter subunit D